jgi:hypothetical protein
MRRDILTIPPLLPHHECFFKQDRYEMVMEILVKGCEKGVEEGGEV